MVSSSPCLGGNFDDWLWIASPHLPPLLRFADAVEEGVDLRRNLPGGESQQGRGCVSARLLEVAGSAIGREERQWHGVQRSLSELCVGYGNLGA